MNISLSVIEGPHQGREFTFDRHDTFIVGRGRDAHFRLPMKDMFFSRIHFMVEVNPPACRIMDMGSLNGTFVNGRQVSVEDLKDGDRVGGGNTLFQVSIDESEHASNESAAATSPKPPPLPRRTSTSQPPNKKPQAVAKPVQAASMPERRFPASRANSCVLCGSSLDDGGPKGTVKLASAAKVCAKCEEAMQQYEQPINGYRIVRELGRGGMGVVYLALCIRDGSPVALKTITPVVAAKQKEIDLFIREAKVLQKLDHPKIVAYRDMGESDGQIYFAMDFVPGIDAQKMVRTVGPLPVDRSVSLVCQLLDALEYAHNKGVVHRDIKPGNVLVTASGGQEHALVADFGLARVYQQSRLSGLTMTGLTRTGDVRCSVPFVAPEQITNYRQAKPPADLFATGATLYNLLTNKYIYDFPKRPEQQLLMILQDEPIPIHSRRPDLPAKLTAVIHRAIAREPKDRFANAAEMRQVLQPFARNS